MPNNLKVDLTTLRQAKDLYKQNFKDLVVPGDITRAKKKRC